MYLIVGLGNPGRKYDKTRHNAGFLVIDALCSQHRIRMWRSKFQGKFGTGKILGKEVALLKPRTYMNRSGNSVYEAVNRLKIPDENILILSDDIALPLETIRLRRKGSDGGHKGLRSIIQELDTPNFSRLRIGVGIPDQTDAALYVLSPLNAAENAAFNETITIATDAVSVFLSEGIDAAMAQYNR